MAELRVGTAGRTRRLLGWALSWASLPLVAFTACGGGGSGDTDGGAGNGPDAGGTAGQSTGGNGSGGGGPGGGDGSGGGSNLEPVDFAEYCELRSDAYFDFLTACYGSEDFPESYREEYVARAAARCMNSEEAIDDGRLAYDPAAAAECLAAVQDVDCVTGETRPICDEVFEGLSEPGEDCYGEEGLIFTVGQSTCANGYCAGDACPGTCETYPGPGEPCSGRCAEGYYCDADEECAAQPTVGDECPDGWCIQGAICADGYCYEAATSETDICGEDVLCAGPTVCANGSCKSRVEIGDPCRLPVHCPSPSTCREETCQLPGDEGDGCANDEDCSEGLYCPWWDPAPECTPFVALGEVCAGESQAKCAPDHACVQAPSDLEATCQERVPEGESCADSFALCEDGVYCNEDALCAPPGEQGEGCWSVHPCAEGLGCFCTAENTDECMTSQQTDGDTCQPRLPDGEPCFHYQECESLDCDLSGSSAPDEPGECVTQVADYCLP